MGRLDGTAQGNLGMGLVCALGRWAIAGAPLHQNKAPPSLLLLCVRTAEGLGAIVQGVELGSHAHQGGRPQAAAHLYAGKASHIRCAVRFGSLQQQPLHWNCKLQHRHAVLATWAILLPRGTAGPPARAARCGT